MARKKVVLVSKSHDQGAKNLASDICQWLKSQGIGCSFFSADPAVLREADLAVIIGGDGTILGIGRELVGSGIPMLGINFGHVGFLTGAESKDWRNALELALQDRMPVYKCLCLQWALIRDSRRIHSGHAVNDIVAARSTLARLTAFKLAIDGNIMGIIRSDGLIASSPLGSSGYNSSALGPIIQPDLDAFCILPICPFPVHIPPLVLRSSARISLEAMPSSSMAYLTIDGQEGMPLAQNDIIEISACSRALTLLGLKNHFVKKLSQCGII